MMMNCSNCIQCCCPCLTTSEDKSKYSYIRYTSSSSPYDPSQSAPIQKQPEMVYEFKQEMAEVKTHPQMFLDTEGELVCDERRSSLPPHVFQSLPVGTQSLAWKATTLPRYCKELPDSEMLFNRGSLPDLRAAGKVKPRPKSPLRRVQTKHIVKRDSWVPDLPVLEEKIRGTGQIPMLQFTLLYDVQHCKLTVHLHHATNLPAKDRRGTSDPFVILYLVPNKEEIFESKVVYKSLNPVFDQSFEFGRLLAEDIRLQTLVFRLYDHDKYSKNDIIGGVALKLKDADLFGVVMRMQIQEKSEVFNEDSNGDLLLSLLYDPTLSVLKGVILKATNLKKQDIIGLADPYIKIHLFHHDKVLHKWKSSIKRNTLLAIYNEPFQFDILGKDITDLHLDIKVMDYDRFTRDDLMGRVILGSNAEGELEQRHWNEMILNVHQSISQWHTIK